MPPLLDSARVKDRPISIEKATTALSKSGKGTVQTAQPSAQFAVAEYKDFGDVFPFRVNQALTGDDTAIQAGINQWAASGGGDTPEAWINALFEVSTGAITYRPDNSRIVVFFGDASSHDPSGGHTLTDAINALIAAGIRVVAINVPGADGLDASGQATAVTTATDGVFLNGVPPSEVSEAILAGIQSIDVTVTPTVGACDSVLSLGFAPAGRVVQSGDDAAFTETVTVSGAAAAGTYHCTVDFPVDGVSQGFVQQLTVVVPGLSINDVSVPEGGGPATFTVTLDVPSPSPVSVHFATANGSASAPADYASTSGDLIFTPGQTSKPVAVPIVSDTVDELNETFTIALSAASGAALTDPTGTGTIVDDDRNGVFTCQATVLQVNAAVAVRANPPNNSCADDVETAAQVQLSAA